MSPDILSYNFSRHFTIFNNYFICVAKIIGSIIIIMFFILHVVVDLVWNYGSTGFNGLI